MLNHLIGYLFIIVRIFAPRCGLRFGISRLCIEFLIV
jgi:hypothetical protein